MHSVSQGHTSGQQGLAAPTPPILLCVGALVSALTLLLCALVLQGQGPDELLLIFTVKFWSQFHLLKRRHFC